MAPITSFFDIFASESESHHLAVSLSSTLSDQASMNVDIQILIEFHLTTANRLLLMSDGEPSIVAYIPLFSDGFLFEYGFLFLLSMPETDFSGIMESMQIPPQAHPILWEKISSFVREEALKAIEQGKNKVYIVTETSMWTTELLNEEDVLAQGRSRRTGAMLQEGDLIARAIRESFEIILRRRFGFVPASLSSSIRCLWMKTYNEMDSVSNCRICLEDFEIGVKITYMPCLHVFHYSCLMQWLDENSTCPLCRYNMSYF